MLLANEEKLWAKDTSQKEKVIGQTLAVVADIDAALEGIMTRITGPAQPFLPSHSDLISAVFQRAEHHNLRSLGHLLWDFSRLYEALSDAHRNKPEGMRTLLELYLALGLEVKAGTLTREDLGLRAGYDLKGDDPKYGALRTAAKKHDRGDVKFGRAHSILPAALSIALLCDGAVNAEEINRTLAGTAAFSDPEDEEDWQTVWWASRRAPKDVAAAFVSMEKNFAERAYHVPGVMLHVFYMRMKGRKMGLTDVPLEQIEQDCEAYIADLEASGWLPEHEQGFAGGFDESSYGGLGYPRMNDGTSEEDIPAIEAFWRLEAALKAARQRVAAARRQDKAKEVLVALKSDPSAFTGLIWRNEKGKEGPYRHLPVLAALDPSAFANALCNHEGEALSEIGQTLYGRYQSYHVELAAELVWLTSLKAEMLRIAEARAQEHPVWAWQIRNFVRWSLDPHLAELADQDAAGQDLS
ncbi:MAG: hypothetical protein ORN49_14700 [Rhodobacteraceae bacterium]|nr:hypothetical protein [Paracoccaceae bacterium]